MASKGANNFRKLMAGGVPDFNTDVFKIILMQEGFVFNPDTHALLADVDASELANGFGYTTGGATLAGVVVTQNDIDDRVDITWNNVSWTANAGDIGPVCGAIIYDSTLTAPNLNAIVGFIDFGGAFTEPDGGIATIANIKVRI